MSRDLWVLGAHRFSNKYIHSELQRETDGDIMNMPFIFILVSIIILLYIILKREKNKKKTLSENELYFHEYKILVLISILEN